MTVFSLITTAIGVIAGALATFLTSGRVMGSTVAIGASVEDDHDGAVAVELAALRAEVAELSRLLRAEREAP